MDTMQLVLRAQEGDEQALEELYYDSYKQAYAVALLMAGNEEDAYDIMQEAYYKAFSNLDLLTNKATFHRWFYQIAMIKIRDFLKQKRGIELFFNVLEKPQTPVYTGQLFTPEPDADYSESAHIAAQMFGSLNAEQKLTLAATVLTELSAAELAESLDVSETMVENALNSGKFALQSMAESAAQEQPQLQFAPEETVSFITFVLCREAGAAEVHEPALKVKRTLIAEPTVSHPAPKASEKKPLLKSRGQKIAVIAGGAILLLGLVFCFLAFALPAITGKANPVSSLVFGNSTSDSASVTPETLMQDFEKAFQNNDEEAMAELFPPDERNEQKTKGFGLTKLKATTDTFTKGAFKYEFSMDDVTYHGDTATAPVTVAMKLGGTKLREIKYQVSFVKQDGRWYIREFKS